MTAKAMLVLVFSLTARAGDHLPAPDRPALPYESEGVCPFECCTYRTWTVDADTDILVERQEGAAAAFRVRRGQLVQGVTGVVVTTKLGRAVVRRPTTIGVGSAPVAVEPGDAVYILHYVGEGYWKFWIRGRVDSDQLPEKGVGCVDDAGRSVVCAVQITEEPQTTWWAKIRSRGRQGWTRQVDHFSDIDACG